VPVRSGPVVVRLCLDGRAQRDPHYTCEIHGANDNIRQLLLGTRKTTRLVTEGRELAVSVGFPEFGYLTMDVRAHLTKIVRYRDHRRYLSIAIFHRPVVYRSSPQSLPQQDSIEVSRRRSLVSDSYGDVGCIAQDGRVRKADLSTFQ